MHWDCLKNLIIIMGLWNMATKQWFWSKKAIWKSESKRSMLYTTLLLHKKKIYKAKKANIPTKNII